MPRNAMAHKTKFSYSFDGESTPRPSTTSITTIAVYDEGRLSVFFLYYLTVMRRFASATRTR